MSNTPTDKELEAFAIEEQFLLFCDVDEFTQIARAVLAKWAAPQPAPAPLSECLRLLNSFEYEGDEDSQAKAFFKAHINEDWFFHVKNSLELALAAQGGK